MGAFFGEALEGFWARVQVKGAPKEARFFVLTMGLRSVILATFYAPHAGRPSKGRSSFYHKLGSTWAALKDKYPTAYKVMMGDANLPGWAEKQVSECKGIEERRIRTEQSFENR